MKKQKKLVLSLTSALVVANTLFPTASAPMIYASNIAVPTINFAEAAEGGVKLQWDTPINGSSIFFKEDFEGLSLDLPTGIKTGVSWYGNGHIYDEYGNTRPNDDRVRNSLKIIAGVGYEGTKGVKVTETIPNNGWCYEWYNYIPSPNGGSDISNYYINKYAALKVGKPAIVRLKAKGSGNVGVTLTADFSGNAYAMNSITWGETLSPTDFKQRLISGTKIKINNPTGYTNVRFHVATAECTTYNYNFYLSVGVIEQVGEQWYFVPYEWHGAWSDSVKPGQSVMGNSRANEGTTEGKAIYVVNHSGGTYSSTNVDTDTWKDYSFNIDIRNTKEIIDTGSYFKMVHNLSSKTNLYIDDVTVAYAPLSRVYRDGILLAEDYTAEYMDIAAEDKASPEAPTNITANITNGKVELLWNKPIDHGTNHVYAISSVNENNEESSKSLEKVVNVATGIDHYEVYKEDKLLASTNTTNYILPDESTMNKVSIVAVDKAGNKSVAATLEADTMAPVVTHTLSTTDWVKDSVQITVTASDEGYGVKSITSPNGQVTSGDKAVFTAGQNGVYQFSVIDVSGNSIDYSVEIKNIDKTAPTKPKLEKSKDVLILTPGIDSESGINKHEYSLDNVTWQNWEANLDLTTLQDGTYDISAKAIEKVSNESDVFTYSVKITYQQVTEAIGAVEKVEETFASEDYDIARGLVDALDPSDIKEELTERLDMMTDMIEEDRLLRELQAIKIGVLDDSISEDEFDALVERFELAKEQVANVIDKTTKKRLQKLVDEIEAIIAAKKHHLTDKTFILAATPQIDENNVLLEWDTDINLLDYTYRIFAQKDNEDIQSIPVKDNVKVLEVYPSKSYLPTWVNNYDTVGKISCDAMSIEAFNTNPEVAWKYDVIVLGFADSNGRKDLIDKSASVLKQCIESGKGVLFGHDTLSAYLPRPYLCSLAPYVNITTTGGDNYQAVAEAYIAQNGGIVNYPYYVGNLEEDILVPPTHASYQVPSGNVWVRFNKDNQFYLTTWNNCAMIQTGHNPNATSITEQKLLLNTIYYLAQITEETCWNDYMGQDLGRPTTPTISNIQTETKDSVLRFNLNSNDEGTTYTYYAEATCVSNESKVQSNTASAIMVSGLKGYSVVIDEKEGTIPDNEVEVTDDAYSVSVDFSKPFYIHVKAIDHSGNNSQTLHYYYTDKTAPTTPSMIVEDDTLKLIKGEDYGFGIAEHIYSLNGSEWKTWSEDISLVDFKDGVYTLAIKAVDNAGNESETFNYSINITYHQDEVEALLEEIENIQVILEDYEITQEEFERAVEAFETLKIQINQVEDIEDSLLNAVTQIESILEQREIEAEARGTRAEYYVRLAENYHKDSYIERARQYVEDLIGSFFKKSLVLRLDEVATNIEIESQRLENTVVEVIGEDVEENTYLKIQVDDELNNMEKEENEQEKSTEEVANEIIGKTDEGTIDND